MDNRGPQPASSRVRRLSLWNSAPQPPGIDFRRLISWAGWRSEVMPEIREIHRGASSCGLGEVLESGRASERPGLSTFSPGLFIYSGRTSKGLPRARHCAGPASPAATGHTEIFGSIGSQALVWGRAVDTHQGRKSRGMGVRAVQAEGGGSVLAGVVRGCGLGVWGGWAGEGGRRVGRAMRSWNFKL